MIVSRTGSHGSSIKLPLFSMTIAAGPPSPVEDHVEDHIDLALHLIPHPERSFLVRVKGDSMIDVGINDGDLLVVEREAEARNGDIVVAVVAGQFTVKRFCRSRGLLTLVPASPTCPAMPRQDFSIWGIARYSIHKL
jgi:DNA polymerase V